MPVVMSAGTLARIQPAWWPTNSYGSLRLYDQYNYDYAKLWKAQPNVRTCVDFLSRNVAQLGLHVYRRVSDTDRERVRDHPLAEVLGQPLPAEFKVTGYRLIEALMGDLGVYYNAYWLKVRRGDGFPMGLLRIPPQFVKVEGGLMPTNYKIELSGWERDIDPGDIVHFRGYNAESAIVGMSPLETLRRILAEEHAAGDYREHFWQNAARMNGIIERPSDAPGWTRPARERFKAEFEILYSGGENSGKTAILEEGMTWKPVQFSSAESEYLAGRKLTREECARAYHIPLPMVGILDHATFSNIKEQHKNLYQDSLGPWLKMIEAEIQLQLLPEFDDVDGLYVEFNIQEKLAGSFEEQVAALSSSVGAPWMTRNEARARQNLPSIEHGDEVITPLNVMTGGLASPRDTAPDEGKEQKRQKGFSTKALDVHNQKLRARHEEQWRRVLKKHYERQQAALVGRVPEAAGKAMLGDVWDEDRWDRELYEDLLPLNFLTSNEWAGMVLSMMDDKSIDRQQVEEAMMPYLTEHTRIQAENINAYTARELEQAILSDDPRESVKSLFKQAVTVWAIRQAVSAVTSALNFGATEGAKASGLRRKTWQVNSSNPRPDHAALNGVTVGIRERFPNGLRWPGDPQGDAEDNANCMCSVRFS
jgi:HK97 family phage portal protein